MSSSTLSLARSKLRLTEAEEEGKNSRPKYLIFSTTGMFKSCKEEGSGSFTKGSEDLSVAESVGGNGSILFKGRRTDLDQLILKPEI